jgi:hypothetical protein
MRDYKYKKVITFSGIYAIILGITTIVFLAILPSSPGAQNRTYDIYHNENAKFHFQIITFDSQLSQKYLGYLDPEDVLGNDADLNDRCREEYEDISYRTDLTSLKDSDDCSGWKIKIYHWDWQKSASFSSDEDDYSYKYIFKSTSDLGTFNESKIDYIRYGVPTPVDKYLKNIDWASNFVVNGREVSYTFNSSQGYILTMKYLFSSTGVVSNYKLLSSSNELIYEVLSTDFHLSDSYLFVLLILSTPYIGIGLVLIGKEKNKYISIGILSNLIGIFLLYQFILTDITFLTLFLAFNSLYCLIAFRKNLKSYTKENGMKSIKMFFPLFLLYLWIFTVVFVPFLIITGFLSLGVVVVLNLYTIISTIKQWPASDRKSRRPAIVGTFYIVFAPGLVIPWIFLLGWEFGLLIITLILISIVAVFLALSHKIHISIEKKKRTKEEKQLRIKKEKTLQMEEMQKRLESEKQKRELEERTRREKNELISSLDKARELMNVKNFYEARRILNVILSSHVYKKFYDLIRDAEKELINCDNALAKRDVEIGISEAEKLIKNGQYVDAKIKLHDVLNIANTHGLSELLKKGNEILHTANTFDDKQKLENRLVSIENLMQKNDFSNAINELNDIIGTSENSRFYNLLEQAKKQLIKAKELRNRKELEKRLLSIEYLLQEEHFPDAIKELEEISIKAKEHKFEDLINKTENKLKSSKTLDIKNRELENSFPIIEKFIKNCDFSSALKEINHILEETNIFRLNKIRIKAEGELTSLKELETKYNSLTEKFPVINQLISDEKILDAIDQLDHTLTQAESLKFGDIVQETQKTKKECIELITIKEEELKNKLNQIDSFLNEEEFNDAFQELDYIIKYAKSFNFSPLLNQAQEKEKESRDLADLTERTKRVNAILKFEYNNQHEITKADMVRHLNYDVDDTEYYIELLDVQINYDPSEIPELKLKTIEIIKKYEQPTMYDLMVDLEFYFDDAKKMGKYLIDEGWAKEFPRFPKKLKTVSEPTIIPEETKKCIVCKGDIKELLYQCSYCHSNFHLKCAIAIKKQGKNCFQCFKSFPPLPELPDEPKVSIIGKEDPIIVSIQKISEKIDDLLDPDEIRHKDLTSRFAQLKQNLVEELQHKISFKFYTGFEEQIELIFKQFNSLNVNNIDELSEIKKTQSIFFNSIVERFNELQDGQQEIKTTVELEANKIINQLISEHHNLSIKESKIQDDLDELYRILNELKISGDQEQTKKIEEQIILLREEVEQVNENLDKKIDALINSVEDIINNQEDIRAFLIKRIGSDWDKIKDVWSEYQLGEINKKKMILKCIKTLGSKFLKKILIGKH